MSSCDGSGKLPSVDDNAVGILLDYIISKTDIAEFIDFGTGKGILPRHAHETGKANILGIEGNKELYEESVCPLNRMINDDVCHIKSILKKYELSTSFEMIEHIPRELQLKCWNNITKYSKKHLCSIHTALPEHDGHPTILSREGWESFFRDNNIKFEYLDDFPLSDIWDCSGFWLLHFDEATLIESFKY